MTVSKKAPFRARFGLGINSDPDGTQVGTLAELLKELNQERAHSTSGWKLDIDAVAIDSKSLNGTLKFIQQVTGRTLSGTTKKLPVSTLKVIKLLYNANDSSDRQLFNLIAPPSKSKAKKARATMEFCTTSSIARDKDGTAIIQHLLDQLAKEIDPQKVESFNTLFSTAEQLNLHIEELNDEIYRLLKHRWGDDQRGLTWASMALTKKVHDVRFKNVDETRQPPLPEVMYCHLRSLGFIHFVAHHRTFIEGLRVRLPIHPIDAPMSDMCRSLSEVWESSILPTDEVVPVESIPKLVACYTKKFGDIVKAATGLGTRKEALIENALRAQRILAVNASRYRNETAPHAQVVSMIDIAAALCSARYEQKVKTAYKPYWPGQVDQGDSPQRHLDRMLDADDPYQHQGTFLVYLYRFNEFRCTFMGTVDSDRAWMEYQLARLDAYIHILNLQDVDDIIAGSILFDELCADDASEVAEAQAFPRSHTSLQ